MTKSLHAANSCWNGNPLKKTKKKTSIVMLTSSLECLLLAAMVGAQRRLAKSAKRTQSSAWPLLSQHSDQKSAEICWVHVSDRFCVPWCKCSFPQCERPESNQREWKKRPLIGRDACQTMWVCTRQQFSFSLFPDLKFEARPLSNRPSAASST